MRGGNQEVQRGPDHHCGPGSLLILMQHKRSLCNGDR
uniref:Uncharacterized protein n=1 Tax=Anguilla anguilla TaxID=7936 RepID=A0A0E9X9S4_ANGAN